LLVGLDLGGTHIDAVIVDQERIIKTAKNEVDPTNLFSTIWNTIVILLDQIDPENIERIILSTTISTNAIVEDKSDRVGVIISPGPGLLNDFSSIHGKIHLIGGAIDHRGVIVEPLDKEQVTMIGKELHKEKIDHCAVITKFSPRNFEMEQTMAHLLHHEFSHITMGHRMSGNLNFPRRVYTSYLNEAVHRIFNTFAEKSKEVMNQMNLKTPLYILKADGGMMDLQTAQDHPVETILSGPAASLSGLLSFVHKREDAILLDVGGTTTDIFFLADGDPLFAYKGATISRYDTLVRAMYSVSVGIGGDSTISIIDEELCIGPTRKGKAFAYGGPCVTPTDAMIYLDLIENATIIEKKRAASGLSQIAKQVEKPLREVSISICEAMAQHIKRTTDALLKEINAKPVYTIRELLQDKHIEPQCIYMIGGPASVLSGFIEQAYSLKCIVPPFSDIGNAIGAALSYPTKELTLLADTEKGILLVPEIGLRETIEKSFTLADAKEMIFSLFASRYYVDENMCEIIEESCFNMVRDFTLTGQNIRVRAQTKPHLNQRWKEEGER